MKEINESCVKSIECVSKICNENGSCIIEESLVEYTTDKNSYSSSSTTTIVLETTEVISTTTTDNAETFSQNAITMNTIKNSISSLTNKSVAKITTTTTSTTTDTTTSSTPSKTTTIAVIK